MTRDNSFAAEDWRRINALLAEALELAPERRAAWLEALAGADHRYRDRLAALLGRGQSEDDDFLRRPLTSSPLAAVEAELDAEQAGRTIGPYTLLREIGAGGMGSVWLAQRTDGAILRPVALKLPRYGWARGIAARLQAERDSLAALAHPHIARLYDAGTTAAGRPYFSMEYVDGRPIDEYVRAMRLTVAGCIELFLQVTSAVAHAHARLIVHRDLKPSNILVTPAGETRLLDFGAAKLLDQGATGPSDLTRESGRVLSPEYAAPEQLRDEPVTVAADVYALGVVLFELLTGTRPHAGTRNAVPEVVPLASQMTADRARARSLRGDLDAILNRALQEDPAARYESVDALAEDLRRYLAGEPVHARRVSAWYRTWRFIARHWVGVGFAALAVAGLCIGLALALWQARVARDEAARASRMTAFLTSTFEHATPRSGVGGPVSAYDLLVDAQQRIDAELGADPALAADVGMVVGMSLDDLGFPERLEPLMARTAAYASRAYGAADLRTLRAELLLAKAEKYRDPQAALLRLERIVPLLRARLPASDEDTIEGLRQQSFTLARLNHKDTSYAALDEAIGLSEQRFGADDTRTIDLLGLRSNTYGRFGDRVRQLAAAQDTLTRATRALGSKRPDPTLTASERWYAQALVASGRPGDAVPLLRRVLADQQSLDTSVTLRVRHARYELARALIAAGQLDEGLPLLRDAAALEMQQNPAETDDRRAFADALVAGLLAAYRIDEAWAEQMRAEAIDARVGNDVPGHALARAERHAWLLALRGDPGAGPAAAALAQRASAVDAEQAARADLVQALAARLQARPREALALIVAATQRHPLATLPAELAAQFSAERGLAALEVGDPAGARDALRACHESLRSAQIGPSVIASPCELGNARLALIDGRAGEARTALAALAARWQRTNPDSPWHGEVLVWQARATAAAGDTEVARVLERRGVALLQRSRLPVFRALAAARAADTGTSLRNLRAVLDALDPPRSNTRPQLRRPGSSVGRAAD
ncbi:MAG: serine/threonine protein kinase [Proteobacteria bacterium]|nr:serine/threonine protein kinase [Pseudomonadota bacterium]